VSSRAIAFCSGAPPRGRWESACRICGEHAQLSSLPTARAVPVEWCRHRKAPAGERAGASAAGGVCPAPLARLEPEITSACLHAARAPPAPGDEPVATRRHFATQCRRDPVSRTTRAVSSLLARAAGSQCSRFHSWASHDPVIRHPSSLCRLARVGDGLTLS
jgi:hypothetical protein